MAHERHPAVALLFIKEFYCLIREISKQPIYSRFVIQSIILLIHISSVFRQFI